MRRALVSLCAEYIGALIDGCSYLQLQFDGLNLIWLKDLTGICNSPDHTLYIHVEVCLSSQLGLDYGKKLVTTVL